MGSVSPEPYPPLHTPSTLLTHPLKHVDRGLTPPEKKQSVGTKTNMGIINQAGSRNSIWGYNVRMWGSLFKDEDMVCTIRFGTFSGFREQSLEQF